MKPLVFALLALFISSSCVSVSEEEARLAEGKEVVQAKSPAMAAGLSILPGVGNLYLASETPSGEKNHELGVAAIVNWATWPVSILWSVPQAYKDAESINIKETAKTQAL